jgi:hypothetical protein
VCHWITFSIDSVLKHCAANRKRWLSALPNIGPYIYNVKISGFTRSSIYNISRLRVKTSAQNSSGIFSLWRHKNII